MNVNLEEILDIYENIIYKNSRNKNKLYNFEKNKMSILYDLCYKLNETSFSYKVTDCSLTTMALSNKGDKLLVGDEDGKVSLVKLSQSFYVANSKEETDLKKNNLNKLFEREQAREKALTTAKKIQHKKEQGP